MAFHYSGCSITPFTIPILQELPKEDDYFSSSDERIYIDLRDNKGYTDELEKIRWDDSNPVFYITTKAAAAGRFKLRIFGYSMGEYIYMLTDKGLTMKYNPYSSGRKKELSVESHIDFRTQYVIMTLAGGGLSLMTFWNYCSCIVIWFFYNYLIVDGKRLFINKESS